MTDRQKTSFRLDKSLYEKLRILAAQHRRSMTAQVEHYIATDWESYSPDRMRQYAGALSDARAEYTTEGE
jgi:plasmid stability protein